MATVTKPATTQSASSMEATAQVCLTPANEISDTAILILKFIINSLETSYQREIDQFLEDIMYL